MVNGVADCACATGGWVVYVRILPVGRCAAAAALYVCGRKGLWRYLVRRGPDTLAALREGLDDRLRMWFAVFEYFPIYCVYLK